MIGNNIFYSFFSLLVLCARSFFVTLAEGLSVLQGVALQCLEIPFGNDKEGASHFRKRKRNQVTILPSFHAHLFHAAQRSV